MAALESRRGEGTQLERGLVASSSVPTSAALGVSCCLLEPSWQTCATLHPGPRPLERSRADTTLPRCARPSRHSPPSPSRCSRPSSRRLHQTRRSSRRCVPCSTPHPRTRRAPLTPSFRDSGHRSAQHALLRRRPLRAVPLRDRDQWRQPRRTSRPNRPSARPYRLPATFRRSARGAAPLPGPKECMQLTSSSCCASPDSPARPRRAAQARRRQEEQAVARATGRGSQRAQEPAPRLPPHRDQVRVVPDRE